MSREIDRTNKKRRTSMSRKTPNRTSKPRERPINSVVIGLNDEEIVVGASHEKGVRQQYLLVGVERRYFYERCHTPLAIDDFLSRKERPAGGAYRREAPGPPL